jgi:toluene monooxygenase system protein A
MDCFGALDEFRHTQIPLLLMHELVRWNAQFDWAHKFYHTNHRFAIAARHFFDELTLGQNAIEFHIATNVVLESGFTNLQFVGLASLAMRRATTCSKRWSRASKPMKHATLRSATRYSRW